MPLRQHWAKKHGLSLELCEPRALVGFPTIRRSVLGPGCARKVFLVPHPLFRVPCNCYLEGVLAAMDRDYREATAVGDEDL